MNKQESHMWTKEEIERLVPEGFIRLTNHGLVRDASFVVAIALLQTRLDLETAKNDHFTMELYSRKQAEEISRLRGALERISNFKYRALPDGDYVRGVDKGMEDQAEIARQALKEPS